MEPEPEPELTEEETKDFRKNWDPKIIWSGNVVEELARGEKKQRATTILDNYQLLMKYALANEQSIPATRVYFQKVAAGDSPPPIIKDWFKRTK